MHTGPSQHPLGHEVESQTHAPATQRCPVAHEGLIPHWQLPSVVQLSLRVGLQGKQVEPPKPQLATETSVQVAPLQHPVGQLTPSHAPPMQTPLLQV